MDHLRIEEQNLIDRYVRGNMPAAERAEFEEHFVECAACHEQIEFARSLRQAVRESVVASVEPGRERGRHGFGWRWAAIACAAGMAIALAGSAVLFVERQADRNNLASVRSELASLKRAPVVFGLSLSRDAAQPQTITLPNDARWMVFVAEIDATRYARYRASMVGSRGEEIWGQDSIQPNSPDSISVAIPSGKLRPGTYALTVSGAQSDGSWITVAHFPLRLAAGK
jgi:anti-sigma factor RsiW